jgi:hypothetical protein
MRCRIGVTMWRVRDPAVAENFRAYPPQVRSKLLALRALIFEITDSIKGVGELTETLKWGEPWLPRRR